jgi:branched-subunit amino acid aminotransferase/4-amino-4-deoxychorismate lyase
MDSTNEKYVFLNGAIPATGAVAFENTAFYWGKSVFTTGLIQDGKLAFYSSHENRLRKAYAWLFGNKHIPDLAEILSPLTNDHGKTKYMKETFKIRVTLFENMNGEPQHLLEVSPYKEPLMKPLNCTTIASPVLSFSRPSFVKLGSYAETMRLRNEMKTEPLFFDCDENLMEGAIANIIFLDRKSRKWVTPKSRFTIVEGLGLKEGLKSLKVERTEISILDIENYSAAFFINCLRGVTAIYSIDGIEFRDNETYLKELQAVFEKSCSETGELLWPMEK